MQEITFGTHVAFRPKQVPLPQDIINTFYSIRHHRTIRADKWEVVPNHFKWALPGSTIRLRSWAPL